MISAVGPYGGGDHIIVIIIYGKYCIALWYFLSFIQGGPVEQIGPFLGLTDGKMGSEYLRTNDDRPSFDGSD